MATVATIIIPRAIKMTHVAAQVQVQYPNSGDLTVKLFSPQLTQVTLLAHDCTVQNIDTTFDDSAPHPGKRSAPSKQASDRFSLTSH